MTYRGTFIKLAVMRLSPLLMLQVSGEVDLTCTLAYGLNNMHSLAIQTFHLISYIVTILQGFSL